MTTLNVGVIGCGNISPQYFKALKLFKMVKVAACADLLAERAQARAREFEVPRVASADELLADPDIHIILNLTTPLEHVRVNLAAIAAGKHVYCEKPLAITAEEGRQTLAAAVEKGVLLGCAPDTFLGGGQQTCRKLIDDGWIGRPIAATAFFTCRGHERWHPDPEFYYQRGGGPMLDMGPYYLTALVNLLGPIRRVLGKTSKAFDERVITSQPKFGKRIAVEAPTHVTGMVEFASGCIATIVTSFDIWAANLPRIEVYGADGSLSVPDPNTFGGEIKVQRAWAKEWSAIPHTHSVEVGRGIGLADLACAAIAGRAHRASGQLACHVLEAMTAFEQSSQAGRQVDIITPCQRPAALPPGLLPGQLD